MSPARRPQRPTATRVIADVAVADPAVRRALADVGHAVREEQRDPKLPRQLGKGDLFYVDASGRLVRLSIGTAGQVLTVGADGVPGWV